MLPWATPAALVYKRRCVNACRNLLGLGLDCVDSVAFGICNPVGDIRGDILRRSRNLWRGVCGLLAPRLEKSKGASQETLESRKDKTMKTFFAVCLASFCSLVGGCEISIKIVSDAPQRETVPPKRETVPPKRFYNPATAEDYDNAHRYLERNPEKPAPKQ